MSTEAAAPLQTCRVCLAKTNDGDMVENYGGLIYFCKRCLAERRKRLTTRAERIRTS